MTILVANNALATLAGSYSSTATALTLTAGQGALFPNPTGGDYFLATLVDAGNNLEIIKCTSRSTDTLTVVRGMEGTIARSFNAGDKLDMRITAGLLTAIRDQLIDGSRLADNAVTSAKIATDAVTTDEIAAGAVTTDEIVDAAVTTAKLASGAALSNIGFTPVEQGGGAGQDNNKVHVGWSTLDAKLKAQVDSTDLGHILTEKATADAGSAGYRGIPQNVKNVDYTFALTDAGGHVLHQSSGTHTYTIPPSSSVAFDPGGSALMIINDQGTVNIAPGAGVTLKRDGTGATGARVLAVNGVATLIKIGADTWYVSGSNLT